MAISKWLCTNNTKNMLVKIVHPGGHVELHDRPILAADIMRRNPKSCVSYPNVFKQPWAIVAPETILMPGQKFYVVPINTIRKLQLLSKKYTSSQLQETETTTPDSKNDGEFQGNPSSRGLFKIRRAANKLSYTNLKHYKRGRKGSGLQETKDDNCCNCLINAIRMKTCQREDKSKETGSSETDALANKRNKDQTSSPKRLSSFDNWQPNLEKISEEL